MVLDNTRDVLLGNPKTFNREGSQMAIKDDLARALFPTLQEMIDHFSRKLGEEALEMHDFEATGAEYERFFGFSHVRFLRGDTRCMNSSNTHFVSVGPGLASGWN